MTCPTRCAAILYIGFNFCALTTGCSPAEEAKSPRHSIHAEVSSPTLQIDTDKGFVRFEGRWRTVSNTGSGSGGIPRINTTEALCFKATMTFSENIAKLYDPSEWPGHPNGFLLVANTEFKIMEWSPVVVVARYAAPVADIELRISLADRSVERSLRETKARGSETADSKIARHWVLE